MKPDNSRKIIIDSTAGDSISPYRKYFWLPAAVVGNTVASQNNYLTIERGSLQGAHKGMSVIGPQGIAGVVINTSENYSIAMSLLHRNSKVSAMLKKDNTAGSIEWDGVDPHFLTLKNISRSAKVAKGDTIVTSTYSANFPPYQMVGTVAAISTDPSSNFYVLKIRTATDFFNIQYVYLVENVHYAEQTKLESTKLKTNE
jgi:rod shape-determining protein MreC